MGKGFLADPLGTLFDPKMLKESLATVGGGALGGGVFMGVVGLVKLDMPMKDSEGKEIKDDAGKVLKQKGYFFNSRLKRGMLAATLGLLGGRALWNQQREVSKGLMGAMGGALGSEFVGYLLQQRREANVKKYTEEGKEYFPSGAAYSLGDEGSDAEAALESILRGAGALPEEQELSGHFNGAAETISYENRTGGREVLGSAIEVEDEVSIGAWVGST